MATKKTTPKVKKSEKKANCSVAGSLLTNAKNKKVKSKAGSKLGSKYCK